MKHGFSCYLSVQYRINTNKIYKINELIIASAVIYTLSVIRTDIIDIQQDIQLEIKPY